MRFFTHIFVYHAVADTLYQQYTAPTGETSLAKLLEYDAALDANMDPRTECVHAEMDDTGRTPQISRMAKGRINVVEVPGQSCADGTPYFFLVVPSTVPSNDKITLEFMSGGGCMDSFTCSAEAHMFVPVRAAVRIKKAACLPGRVLGGMAADNSTHPLFGRTHVFLPYCTADVYLGNQFVKYDNNGEVFGHTGLSNVMRVLDWVRTQTEDSPPSDIFLSGSSAGGLGLMLWSPAVAALFTQSTITSWIDSGLFWNPNGDAFSKALKIPFKDAWGFPEHANRLMRTRIQVIRSKTFLLEN